MLHRLHPLIHLLLLRLRANLRYLFRPGSVKRSVMTLVGIGLVIAWLLPGLMSAVMFRARPDPEPFILVAPFMLLAMTLTSLLSARKGGIAFTPAEVDLLFPGPFTRRALLLYKIASTLPGAALFSLLFTIWLGRYAYTYPSAFCAALMAAVFTQLLTIGGAMAFLRLRESGVRRAPMLAAAVLAGGLLAVFGPAAAAFDWEAPMASLRRANELPAVRAVLAPFRVFAAAFAADGFVEFLRFAAAGLAMIAALLAAILRLDANYLEASVAASQRLYEKVQRAKRSGGWAVGAPKRASGHVPDLPFLAGMGPVVWLQLVRLRRQPAALALPVVLAVIFPALLVWQTFRGNHLDAAPLLMLYLPLTIFLTTALRFDFRADFDYLDRLKSLPLRALSVAAGQLAVPVVLMAGIQLIVLWTATMFGPVPNLVFYVGLAFAPLLSAVLLSVDNLVFLLAPTRAPAIGVDLQATGRHAVLALAKFLLIAVAALPAGAAAWLVYTLTKSPLAAGGAAWVCLAAVTLGLVGAVAMAFRLLDVSLDTAA